MRYIDADGLLKELDDFFNDGDGIAVGEYWSSKIVRATIKSKTTSNVVEAVRCKDCKHYKPFLHKKNRKYCFKFDHLTSADDFCSFAERRG